MGFDGKYRALVGACLLAFAASGAGAAAPCRQALALGLDVSGSVDAAEYRLQMDGLAAALTHERVRAALLSMPGAPVRLLVYEWSGPGDQRLVLDWTDVTDATALQEIAHRLATTTRAAANPSTALGTAIAFGARLLAAQAGCWKRTLDISGDGESNTGPRPQDVAPLGAFEGITVNALVIGGTAPDGGSSLVDYFKALVIRGPGAFVEPAAGFDDYEAAMVRKLLREVEGLALSWAESSLIAPEPGIIQESRNMK
jgi:hypothetical protein